ncbi:MAG: HD domain-containing phosphohydrolase [Myxococcota bacterium]
MWTKVAQGPEMTEEIRIPIGVGIAGQVAQTGEIINIPDAYVDPRFNRDIDKGTGYHTRHILGVPLRAHTGESTGVLQVLNKMDRGQHAFTEEDEDLLLALGAHAAAAIENTLLYEEIDQLFEGFVKASVFAIEARDPTTSGHSERVALLTTAIAQKVDQAGDGPYGNLRFDYDAMREIRYAALLHDFGKVGVREHVLTKAKKLYPGELAMIETRFQALAAQRKNEHLMNMLRTLQAGGELSVAHENRLQEELQRIDELLAFVRHCNEPTVLDSSGFERLRDIAEITYEDISQQKSPILSETDLKRLSIPRGTLDSDERHEIESHVTHTYHFLAQIPWTRALRQVPEIAYAHHETLDGAGYPRALKSVQIPVQSRMMTIADIYDALTASDRPYKRAVPHDRALDILMQEAKQQRLDSVLLDIFIQGKVYQAVLTG